jgi:hypothetical protein
MMFHSLNRSVVMNRMIVVLAISLCVAGLASAQLPDGALAIHVSDVPVMAIPDCGDGLATEWPDAQPMQIAYFHVIICGHMYMSPQNYGFVAAEYDVSLDFNGVMLGYEFFADITLGSPGTGISQAWAECQRGLSPYVIARIDMLIIVPPVTMSILPNPMSGLAGLMDCDMVYWQILPAPPGNGRAGWAIAGGFGGYNPCPCVDPNPVEESSWGQIKSLYR